MVSLLASVDVREFPDHSGLVVIDSVSGSLLVLSLNAAELKNALDKPNEDNSDLINSLAPFIDQSRDV